MIVHALPAPVRQFFAEYLPLGGIGSQLQRNLPERASNARTTPLGISTRELSSIDDPTTTRSSITAGGEVI